MNKTQFLIFTILFSSLTAAQGFSLTATKPSFTIGDNVSLAATIDSATEKTVLVKLLVTAANYPPSLTAFPLKLKTGENEIELSPFHVIETTPSGKYEATATLFEGSEKLGEATASFEIAGTLKTMSLEIVACVDSKCSATATLFFKGDTAFLGYNVTALGTSVKATIRTPSGKQETVVLPHDLALTEAGAYSITAVATKAEYQSKTAQLELFASSSENSAQTQAKQIQQQEPPWLAVAAIALIVIALAFLAFKFMRRKK